MVNFSLAEETRGYITSKDPSNLDHRFLVGGSKNVLIDFQKKVKTRSGYTLLGAANQAVLGVRNAWTWFTSTGSRRYCRFYDTNLSVYLGTVDTVILNAWYVIRSTWSSTEQLRSTTWWDTGENLDLLLMVNGDDNIYEWNGAVTVVASASGTSITKQGTDTWAQARFYTTRDKTILNLNTGRTHTYTGGETTTTLTGLNNITDIATGHILIQQFVTQSNEPAADRNNDTIFTFENQICVGSNDDEEVFVSQNDSYIDTTFSTPRVAGDGALLTLDDTTTGFGSIGKTLLVFSGRSSLFTIEFNQITVSTTLAETIAVRKLPMGSSQGAFNQETIVQIGDTIIYLSNEPALRIVDDPKKLTGLDPKTLSNPIKPDFDAETWTNAFGFWYRNVFYLAAPTNSRVYMLNFIEDSDGKLFRFWNPPQTLPTRAMSIIDSGSGDLLHGHASGRPETYLLFDGASDGQFTTMEAADKIPIEAIASFAYNNYKDRANLKTFDEYYVEGEITPATSRLSLILNYDYEGATQQLEKFIDGSDEDILEGNLGNNSLAQSSLAVNPLGGLLNAPSDARRFRVIFEIAKEDFHELQAKFSTNDSDKYWAITAHGASVQRSPRKDTIIKK